VAAALEINASRRRLAVPRRVSQRLVQHQHRGIVEFDGNETVRIRLERHRDVPLLLDTRADVAQGRRLAPHATFTKVLDDFPQFLLVVSQAALEPPQLGGDVAGAYR